MEKEQIFEKLEDLTKHELEQLTQQNSLSGADLEKMIKAICAFDQLDELKERAMEKKYGNSYGGGSYGGSSRAYGGEYGASSRSYDDGRNRMAFDAYGNMSYERGRSRTTGRYMSRGGYPEDRMYRDASYEKGYSGHSISDRMVASLEKMYDEASSPHEQKMIDMWISRIRNGE